jgi:hypothetical protein
MHPGPEASTALPDLSFVSRFIRWKRQLASRLPLDRAPAIFSRFRSKTLPCLDQSEAGTNYQSTV